MVVRHVSCVYGMCLYVCVGMSVCEGVCMCGVYVVCVWYVSVYVCVGMCVCV